MFYITFVGSFQVSGFFLLVRQSWSVILECDAKHLGSLRTMSNPNVLEYSSVASNFLTAHVAILVSLNQNKEGRKQLDPANAV